ncbi:MAG: YfiR family protein, partial [Limisphaerales bacterium]
MAILTWRNPNPAPGRGADFASGRSAGTLRDGNVAAHLRPMLTCCLLGAALAFQLSEARAQSVSREYPLKAVFILNFARFTDWPTNAFASRTAPFVIGILGDNPFGSLME